MRNIMAIAGKEIRTYFTSPIAYLVLTIYAALCGFFFYSFVATYVVQMFRMMETGQMAGQSPNINTWIIRPLFEGVLTVVLLLLLPLVSMRLFAEERKNGTMELLLTSPVTELQIILGKFLGALTLYIAILVLTFIDIGMLFFYGNPDAKPLIAQALGALLFGGALLSLGMWISSLTRNQIIAGAVSLAVFLLLYVFDWVTSYSSGVAGRVMNYMAFVTHFDNFSKGVIDSTDLVYYLSVIVLGIFLTSRSVEALKGRP